MDAKLQDWQKRISQPPKNEVAGLDYMSLLMEMRLLQTTVKEAVDNDHHDHGNELLPRDGFSQARHEGKAS